MPPASQPTFQQHPLTIPTTSPNMMHPQQDMTTSQASTMTTMTKISKTTLAKERRNSSSSSNNSRETQMLAIQIQTQQITPLRTLSNSSRMKTWPHRATLETTEQATTVAMGNMTSSSTMPVPTTRTMTSPSMIRPSMMRPERLMIPQPMTTVPATMTPLHINTTTPPDRGEIRDLKQLQPHRRKNKHPHQQQPRQLLLLQQQFQQAPLAEVAQQKAAHNRERAVALWGQQLQLEASPAQNPICHNSLPRQQPKSSRDPDLDLTTTLSYDCMDPFDLEFSISSPSLMRSFDSDTEVEELGVPLPQPPLPTGEDQFDSISEMTLTPTPTTTRRIAITEIK